MRWVLLLLVACGNENSTPPLDSANACDTTPFEATCRYGSAWSDPGTHCTSDMTCKADVWTCGEGGQLVGARACLATCNEYVAAHPECSCVGDTTYGYELELSCP